MNLHAIPARKNPPTNHYYDYVLDDAFFSEDEDREPPCNYGNLVEVWVEDGHAYGIWTDENEWRWKILVYEYTNDYDMERIINHGDADFTCQGWYVDSGHIP